MHFVTEPTQLGDLPPRAPKAKGVATKSSGSGQRARWRTLTIDVVLPDSVAAASIEELREGVRRLRTAQAGLDAAGLELHAELATRSETSPSIRLTEILKIEGGLSGPAAKRQSTIAGRANFVPDAVAGLAAGDLSNGHLHQLVRAQMAHPETFATQQKELARHASCTSVDLFTRYITNWIARSDPDDGSERFNIQRERRALSFVSNADGTVGIRGTFDPEVGSTIQSAVGHVADDLWRRESRGARPRCSHAQRFADALEQLVTCGSTVGTVESVAPSGSVVGQISPDGRLRSAGPARSPRPVLHVRCDVDLLAGDLQRAAERGVHVGQTSAGAALGAATIRRLACDALIIPTVMGGDSQVLNVGRTRRTATAAQRSALEHRDEHCVFPGCDRPSNWCQVHHLKPWRQGGRTDLDNLALLCSTHHHMVHEGRWRITRVGTRWKVASPTSLDDP